MKKNMQEITPDLLDLVKKAARHYSLRSSVSYDELEAEGYLALLEAMRKFNPKRGVTPRTFAYKWIQGSILKHLNKEKRFRRSGNMVLEDAYACGAAGTIGVDPIRKLIFDQSFKDLSDEAKVLVDMVLDRPEKLQKTVRGDNRKAEDYTPSELYQCCGGWISNKSGWKTRRKWQVLKELRRWVME